MHELAIVQQVVDLVVERSEQRPVLRLVLEIGRLSLVLPDAVRFCFDLATSGTVLEGAVLEIVTADGRARCRACRRELVVDRPVARCSCGRFDLEWLAGTSVRIVEMEVA